MFNGRLNERVLVLVTYGSLLLLGRMETHKIDAEGNAHPWGVPGGKRRSIERLVRTAKRELREETRKHLRTGRFTYRGRVHIENENRTYHVFSVALMPTEYRERIPPHREFIEFKWFPIEALPFDQMLAEHREWLPQVLDTNEPVNVTIN